ncbi:hypothetical protein [Oceanivirga salmonicida]|uniref:hypothetical protein n=1 Tax=Oceanivirga salmonicida TaxID=1769291 RepID=UPI0012E13DB0|nr:hypothetical protein [Oceanivirga salmonicida]
MKKIFLVLLTTLSMVIFAKGHDEIKLENAKHFHSMKGQLHTHMKIGTHDGKYVADLGELLGHMNLEKTKYGYISENKSSTIIIDKKTGNASLNLRVLAYDRTTYSPDKYPKKDLSFHSYNGGFNHIHIDFNKNYSEVKIGDQTFKGTLKTNKETNDRIFTEANNKFVIVLYGKYDDFPKHKLPNLTRLAELIVNVDFSEIKGKNNHK